MPDEKFAINELPACHLTHLAELQKATASLIKLIEEEFKKDPPNSNILNWSPALHAVDAEVIKVVGGTYEINAVADAIGKAVRKAFSVNIDANFDGIDKAFVDAWHRVYNAHESWTSSYQPHSATPSCTSSGPCTVFSGTDNSSINPPEE